MDILKIIFLQEFSKFHSNIFQKTGENNLLNKIDKLQKLKTLLDNTEFWKFQSEVFSLL